MVKKTAKGALHLNLRSVSLSLVATSETKQEVVRIISVLWDTSTR